MGKILILSDNPYPGNAGGIFTFLNTFEKGLRYYKKDYEIISPKFYRGQKLPKSSNVKNLGWFLVKFDSFLLRSCFKILYYLSFHFSLLLYLLKDKKYQEFDSIFVQDIFFTAPIALLMRRITQSKVLFATHNGRYPLEIKKMFPKRPLIWFIVGLWDKFIIKKFNAVFCINRATQEYYSPQNKKSVFIPNFIDISDFSFRVRKKINTIAYIGRLAIEKRIELVVMAAKHFPDKKFLIIGGGPEEEKLKKIARDLKIKNCLFLGSRSDISNLHKKIDLSLYLREDEPFGISALESLASGIPVISADVNELHYFIGKEKTGIVLPQVDISSLVNAINKINQKGKLEEYSKRTRKVAERYDYHSIVWEYIKRL